MNGVRCSVYIGPKESALRQAVEKSDLSPAQTIKNLARKQLEMLDDRRSSSGSSEEELIQLRIENKVLKGKISELEKMHERELSFVKEIYSQLARVGYNNDQEIKDKFFSPRSVMSELPENSSENLSSEGSKAQDMTQEKNKIGFSDAERVTLNDNSGIAPFQGGGPLLSGF